MADRSTYAQKLTHPEWQKRRLRIMERAGFRCEWCGVQDRTLHIHHGYYQRNFEPWEYLDEVMHCLCETCHREAEQLKRDAHIEIGRIPPKYLAPIIGKIMQYRLDIERRSKTKQEVGK